ncbi:MAG: cell division protein FtsZ [Candidatus Paceibacterota bacterium]|jgi:cell division protein FtsZ
MELSRARIKVVGVGGSGSNTVDRIMKAGIADIELISFNTDAQDLAKKDAHQKIRIGKKLTLGSGAGMNPEVGRMAAKESSQEITQALQGADLIFLAAGLGGGTGSGASPVIAEIARKAGAIVVGVATLPFNFEGRQRRNVAAKALKDMRRKVNTMIVIRNDKLSKIVSPKDSIETAFAKCDEVLEEAIRSIAGIVLNPGILNLDFADIKQILAQGGMAYFGAGIAEGKDRARSALKQAIASPIVVFPLNKAKGVMFNAASSGDFSLNEVSKIGEFLKSEIPDGAKVVFGASFDKSLKKGQLKVTVIACGSEAS